jgi:hypothetical protein
VAVTGSVAEHPPRRVRWVRRPGLVAIVFIGYFLLGTAWALAAPFDGPPDEREHIVRASGVLSGEVMAAPAAVAWGTGAMQTVPQSLVRENCWRFASDRSAACDRGPHTDQTLVRQATVVGRYNPVYYAVVGLPLRLSPTMTGVVVARLINSAIIAALLALAVSAARRWSRHRVMLAGVGLLATPVLMNLAGAVNPSGVEIAAGILFFAALIPMLDADREFEPAMVAYAGVAATILATVRSLGPFWLAVGLLALLLFASRARLARLGAMRLVQRWAFVVWVAILAGVAWTIVMHATEVGHGSADPPYTTAQAIGFMLMNQWVNYLSQMVAGLSWLDVPVPLYVPLLWSAALALLIGGALLLGRRVDRARIGLILLVVFGLPLITDSLTPNKYDFPTQGRYLLPLFAGAVLLSCEVLVRSGVLTAERSRTVVRTLAVVIMSVLHVTCLIATMVRWQSGASLNQRRPRFNPLAGPWHPAVGSVLPLVLGTVAVLVIGYAYWRLAGATTTAAPSPPDDRVPLESPSPAMIRVPTG